MVKLLWLAICNIEDKRARDREKERGNPSPSGGVNVPSRSRGTSKGTSPPQPLQVWT